MSNQNTFSKRMGTPWGSINTHTELVPGIISVDTPGHGGLWLSDEWIEKLPDAYEPYTGTKRWAEEDEDAPLVLQYLGLLSLMPEAIMLNVTDADIVKGRETRKPYEQAWVFDDKGYYGGPIVEAYKRQTGDDEGDMVCYYHLSKKPTGFRLAQLTDEARDWMERFDAGEAVSPFSFELKPFTVPYPETFQITRRNGKKEDYRASGGTSKGVIEGDAFNIRFFVECLLKDDVTKIEHKEKVIWERKTEIGSGFGRE